MNVLKIRNEMRSGKSIFDLPLRVTFYARVSTDKDEQLNSLENQVQYYTELIQSKPNWTYIPGYIDEGISGTSTRKRDSFLRMISDAKAGRFDFIITKEISRFSRSTLDSIQYTQELLEHDVGVLFQNDNINTLDSDSEFRLVVMAGVAQDEVRKLSERLKFGFRQAIKNGHVLGNDKLWGYDKKDCVLTISEAEAQVVRRIFHLYANEQMGIRRISQQLYDEGFTSRKGNAFNVLTIRHILESSKYKGWYCANKSQTVEYRSKRKIFLDESEWVMYPDPSIPAIVSEELWDRANVLYKRHNDASNQQLHELEGQMEALKAEGEKSQISVEQLGKIKAALEAELSFQNGVNSALVATILDHIVVKKGSTKEEVHLDIYLKFGDPYGVVFDRENSSFCFTRPKSTTPRQETRTT